MRTLMLIVLLAGLAAAQDPAAVSGPTLGYIFDSTARAAVPVLGLPGAAISAQPLDAGVELAAAEAAPSGELILALSAKDSAVLALRPGLPAAPVRGAAPAPDRIVFSPSGARAALFYGASNTIQVVSGAVVIRTLTADLAGPLSSIAIADTGLVLVADSAASGSTVWLLDARRQPRQPRPPRWNGEPDNEAGAPVAVLSVGGHAAIAFLPNSSSALVADPAAHLLYRVADVRRPGAATVIAGAAEGVAEPDSIAVSPAGAYAVLAQADGRLLSIDLHSGQTAAALCDCHPSRVQPLALGPAFALFDGARVLLFEAGPEPRFFFLPAGSRGAR